MSPFDPDYKSQAAPLTTSERKSRGAHRVAAKRRLQRHPANGFDCAPLKLPGAPEPSAPEFIEAAEAQLP